MLGRSQKFIALTLLLFILAGSVTGCSQSASTSNITGDLTANQAAQIVYEDLSFHGIAVEKVNVTDLSFSSPTNASAVVSFVTAEGKPENNTITFVKLNDQWQIPEHSHK